MKKKNSFQMHVKVHISTEMKINTSSFFQSKNKKFVNYTQLHLYLKFYIYRL